MKRLWAILLLSPWAAFAAGPEFRHDDPIIQREFDNVYKDIRSILPRVGSAECIDSPTFCVDTVNNRVGVGNATPSTVLHLSSGTLTIDGSMPSNRAITAGGDVVISSSVSGSSLLLTLTNGSNTASSGARIAALVGGASADDPWILLQVAGATSWSTGIDNSDSDMFKISNAATLGTNDRFTMTTAGVATFSGQLIGAGTTAADNAAAGYIGEAQRSAITSDTNFASTGVWGDGTSLSLTAGDWDVCAIIVAESQTGTWSNVSFGIGSSSGTSTTGLTRGDNFQTSTWANSATTPTQYSGTLCGYRVNQSSTVTWYLKESAIYTAGQPQFRCRLSARRVR
jgi:hypothetical protein